MPLPEAGLTVDDCYGFKQSIAVLQTTIES